MKKTLKSSANIGFGKFKGNLSIAAAAVLMSMNTAWAAAECQVFTTDAAGSPIARTSVAPAGADNTCYLGTYTPEVNDGKNGQAVADGAGSEVTLKGNGQSIHRGSVGLVWGSVADPTLFDAKVNGVIVDISNGFDVEFLNQTNPTTVPDPITGSNMTIKTFANADIRHSLTSRHRNQYAPVSSSDGQYIDMRFATAANGGKVKVNLTDVGNGNTSWFQGKQSTLMEANSGGSIEWEGTNRLFFDETYKVISSGGQHLQNVHLQSYQNVEFMGTTYTIYDIDGLRAYNDALIAALRNGTFPMTGSGRTPTDYENAYKAQLNRALRTETVGIYSKVVANPNDDRAQDVGNLYVMRATGNGSSIKMKAGSTLVHYIRSQGMHVDSGASGEIEEGARLSGYSHNVVVDGAASTFNNRGVISSGFSALDPNSDSSNTTPGRWLQADGDYHFDGYAATVSNGATFNNEGVINISSSDRWLYHNYGIGLNGGQAVNAAGGAINVAINNNGQGPWGFIVSGVRIFNNANPSTFDNQGEIYVGRTAQQSKGAETQETEEKHRTYGIWQQGKGNITHSGKITTGTKIENSIAYFLDNATDSTVNLTAGSEILVKGDKPNSGIGAPPLTNYGLYALRTGNSVINADGKITLTGVNARAIQAEGNSTVNVANSGEITVHGGRDIRQGARNFGVYAEGFSDTDKATVNFGGKVNLSGEGAIGLHARGHAEILNTGTVEMTGGRDQIGYFIHGPNAKITGGATTLDVTTEGSTMFRIAGGASYDTSGMEITTSGKNSTAIVVTGESNDATPIKSKVNTAGGTYHITGEGSNFITVEGGAKAEIDGTSRVNLTGVGAVIGIVDGQGYGLFKDPDGPIKQDSYLVSSLRTETDMPGTTTYITRSRGNLDFGGNYINLLGPKSVAFKMEDGGRLTIADAASFLINGDAIQSHGTNSYSGVNGGHTNQARLERNEINATNVLNAQSGALEVDSRGQSLLTGAARTESGATSRLSLSEESVWNITDNSTLTTLINRGTINFSGTIADPKDRSQYHRLVVNGDYVGVSGSTLSVNSNWYQPNDLYTNSVVIKGNATGRTRVMASNGIGGDVRAPQSGDSGPGIDVISATEMAKYDSRTPVISVLGHDNFDNDNPTFVGDAVIRDSAEVAQLVKKGKHYYWTLTATLQEKKPVVEESETPTAVQAIPLDTGVKLYAPMTAAYLQTSLINREAGYDLLGKLTDRVGEQQFDCDCVGVHSWSRLSYQDGYRQGEERFAYGSKRGLVQFGQDLHFSMNETHRTHTGLSVGYSWSQNRFYDKYRSVNGRVSEDKETLGSKSHVVSLGAYQTRYFANGSYLDLVLNGNWVHNQYRSEDRQHRPSQDGYGVGASVELGRLFKLGESAWYIQPQAQLKAQYLHLNDMEDGVRTTRVKDQTGVQGRLGARLTNGTFYVGANLVHDIVSPKSVVRMGSSELEEHYGPTSADIAVGGDFKLSSDSKWQLYSDVRYSRVLGKTHEVFTKKAPGESYNARVGVRYSW